MGTEGIDLKKRIFCMILALALILGLAPGVLAAETGDGTKTITAQPSAAAADAPAVLPEQEPLKNVTGAEPEDVVTYASSNVARLQQGYINQEFETLGLALGAAMTGSGDATVTLIGSETTVPVVEDVEGGGSIDIQSANEITLDLNGHELNGCLKIGQTSGTQSVLYIKDSATGGSISKVEVYTYGELYLDGAVSTMIGELVVKDSYGGKVKLTQGYVKQWSFNYDNESITFLSCLASGSCYHLYEDGQLGRILDNSKNEYETYGRQGKMAAVRCPHDGEITHLDTGAYKCGICNALINPVAQLTDAEGSSTYYMDRSKALTAVQASGGTLKLLDDWVGRQFTAEQGTFTLDLNGKKLYDRQTGGSYPVLLVTGTANLTLINTADTQAQVLCYSPSSIARAIEINSANARLQVGNTDGSASNIDVPHYRSAAALYVTDGTVRLYGGRLGSAKITKTDGMLIDLLPDGRAFSADANGTQIIDLSNKNPKEYWSSLYVVSHTCTFTSSGKCTDCGRPCTHPSFNENGTCTGCGEVFHATLTKDGASRAFETLSGAIAEAQKADNKGCTVALVQNAESIYQNGLEIAENGCDFTLDLNGHNLNGGPVLFTLAGANQKVTITNSGKAATLWAGTLVSVGSGNTVTINGNNITFQIKANTQRDGTLIDFAADATAEMKVIINGGTYEKDENSTDNFRLLDINRPNASVEINGGTFAEIVYVSNGGQLRVTGDSSNPKFEKVLRIEGATADVKLSGGCYKEIYYGGYSGKGSHLELLENRYAFYGYNGSLINTAAEVGGESLTYRGDEFYVARHDRHDPQPEDDGRCVCGYLCPHEDMSDDALWCSDCGMQYVVTTKNGTKTTHHTRLKYAMQAAEDGATITLLGTTVLGDREVTVSGKTVTINLNGQKLDSEGSYSIQTLKIESTGAVIFTGSGSVNCVVELDKDLTTENNKTAFLGGTFTKIISKKDTVLPALAKANGFAFRKDAKRYWETLDELKIYPLEGVTAYPVPVTITKVPATNAEMTYGDTMLPEALRPEFERTDNSYFVGFTWTYSKDGQDLGQLTTAGFYDWGSHPENYKIRKSLPAGTYDLSCSIVVENSTLARFVPYETVPVATLTVKQQEATVTKAPTPATGLIFDGQQHALLSDGGTAEGGTMVFAPAENGTYMEGIPSGSGAGTYKIWYKVKADANHSDSEPRSVTVTIAPCQLRAQVEDKTMYAGDQLPAFTATYSGFVGNDTAESIVWADTAVFHTDATGKQAGKFDITMTTAPQLNGGNYELDLADVTKGTLTVNERPRMPKVTKDDETPESPFDDVTQGDYFFDPVRWAVDEGIVGGVGGGRFAPHAACTRAQIVTMLWRAAGSPEPKGTAGFADVPAGAYYAKAVAWAAEQGIAAGVGGGRFDPHAPCTRAQAVTLLHRAAGAPDTGADAPFADIPTTAYYKAPVAWATEAGITTGVGDGKFAPDATCTRAQIVTMLYRYFKK